MKAKRICVLCGINEATKGDGDHLPPQNIYPAPREPNVALNKVPACLGCNQAGSKDDEEFKMIIGLSTGDARKNQEALIDSIARTFKGNKKLGRRIAKSSQRIYARRDGGILEPVVAIPFSRDGYSRVITRIVRGLHWQQTGEIMQGKTVQVVHGDEPQGLLLQAIRKLLTTTDPVVLNGGSFVYKAFFDEESGSSFWGLQFFGSHTVFALVTPEAP
ncbi:hypothetical protein ABFV51_10365 [Pseudomonas asgharzadehiana]|uniref:HNH endonuclease n=1 Tax=Pseudomonas fluorescens TaxID=294 RepID=A0A4Y9T8L9_PSEFL|nr:hypothetical protein [Pseudomonas fluorescens]TFW40733.1 hypothetical protein E4T65_25090 [Pseudomonas fluorescens]